MFGLSLLDEDAGGSKLRTDQVGLAKRAAISIDRDAEVEELTRLGGCSVVELLLLLPPEGCFGVEGFSWVSLLLFW